MISHLFAVALAAAASVPTPDDPASDPENWRQVEAENLLVIDTNKGRILVETAPDFAPNHVARIKELTRQNYYDGIIFHRVIGDFMVQTGDPTGTGRGGSGQKINGEFYIDRPTDMAVVVVNDRRTNKAGFHNGMPVVTQPEALRIMTEDNTVEAWLSHCKGMVSMARGDSRNSADSQFFLMRQSYRNDGVRNTFLDQEYSAWGRVVGGLDVVSAINEGTVGETSGFVPDLVDTMRVAADLPDDQRPSVWVLREDGPLFDDFLAEARTGVVGALDVCDVNVPSAVQDPTP